MAHLLRYEEWQSPSGAWYCNDTSEIGRSQAGLWWTPARMLGISLDEYVNMLITKFKVSSISYNEEKNVLVYSWEKQSDMRKFKNWLNAEARKQNFII